MFNTGKFFLYDFDSNFDYIPMPEEFKDHSLETKEKKTLFVQTKAQKQKFPVIKLQKTSIDAAERKKSCNATNNCFV